MRCRKPELFYLNHSTLQTLNEAETRCSNRLLGACAIAVSTAASAEQKRDLNKMFEDLPAPMPESSYRCDEPLAERDRNGEFQSLDSEATSRPQIIAAADSGYPEPDSASNLTETPDNSKRQKGDVQFGS